MTEQELEDRLSSASLTYSGLLYLPSYRTQLRIKLQNLFKEAGYVRLAEVQSLPRDFCQDIVKKYHGREDAGSYKRAQQDMLKANFRKVEMKEG